MLNATRGDHFEHAAIVADAGAMEVGPDAASATDADAAISGSFNGVLTAAAGVCAVAARKPCEAFAWFTLAYLLPLQPVVTDRSGGSAWRSPLRWRPSRRWSETRLRRRPR